VASRGGERVAALDRRPASHWAILRAVPYAIPRRFDAAAAEGLDTSFELRLLDPRGGAPACFELRVSPAGCEVWPGAAARPGAVATLGADDLIRLASGAVGWPQLLSSGRLELAGDPFLALRFPTLFRLPVSAATAPSHRVSGRAAV